jgi:hypothetical protein
MRHGVFDEAVDALRALGDDRDDAAASATRLRIRDSLARGHALRRHAAMFSVLAVLLVASGAWALTSGRVERWIAPAAQAPAVLPDVNEPVVTRPAPHVTVSVPDASEPAATPPAPHITMSVPDVSEPAVTPTAPHVARAPDVVAAPEVGPSAARVVASAPHAAEPRATASHDADTGESEAEALYRAAHELHFHGDDVPAALAAWDAYLAASPHGAFAIEARYNRALCLVKLGRLAEARTALAPFAAGEVAPAGYRRDEAARLIERIDHRLANSVNGSR